MWTRLLFMLFLMIASAGEAVAGGVIIDGTDADEHGFFSDSDKMNKQGWAYMQRALEVLGEQVSEGVDKVIVVLGTSRSGMARKAIDSAFNYSRLARQGDWSLEYREGVQEIRRFLENLPDNSDKTAILLIPTFGEIEGDLKPEEMAVINARADRIALYVKRAGISDGGGCLFAMGESGVDAAGTRAYKWVETLVPGIRVTDIGVLGVESPIELTPAGRRASLPEEELRDSVPWHNYFDLTDVDAKLTNLAVWATGRDGSDVLRNVILGTALPELADLAISKTATSDRFKIGPDIVYTLAVTNNGPDATASATVKDILPANLIFRSVVAPAGWECTNPGVDESGTITCKSQQLAPGSQGAITITTRAVCASGGSAIASNVAMIDSPTSDPIAGNNSATVTVDLEGVPQATISKSSIKFRATSLDQGHTVSKTFIIRNTGCAPLSLTLDSITRNVAGKVLDDSSFFRLRDVGTSEIIIAPDDQKEFRIDFTPVIPEATAPKAASSASQVLPSRLISTLTFNQRDGFPIKLKLIGKVPSAVELIAPVSPAKPPVLKLEKSGDKVTVTFYVFDSDRDVKSVKYDFFNKDGSRIPVEKPEETDLTTFVEQFLVGQSFGVAQDFFRANFYPNLFRVRVTVTDSAGNKATEQTDLSRSQTSSAQSHRDTDDVLLSLPRKKLAPTLHRRAPHRGKPKKQR